MKPTPVNIKNKRASFDYESVSYTHLDVYKRQSHN